RLLQVDGARTARSRAVHDGQGAFGGIAFEREEILTGFRLPAAGAFADHHTVGDGADGEPGERHRLGQKAAQLLHGAGDAPLRHVGGGQRLRRAQYDEILKGEEPAPARPARGRYETSFDQRTDRAARQTKQLLDLAHAILVHAARAYAGATSWRSCALRARPAAATAWAACAFRPARPRGPWRAPSS